MEQVKVFSLQQHRLLELSCSGAERYCMDMRWSTNPGGHINTIFHVSRSVLGLIPKDQFP